MFDIAKYLEKFRVMGNSQSDLRNSIAASIKENCGIEIELKNIAVKDGIIRISERPIIKNEIFFKKEKVLEQVNVIREKKVLDIV